MSEKIKVCHLTSLHPQEDVRIFRKECTSLANNEYDVYLVSKGKTYEKNGVHIIGIENKHKTRIGRMLFFAKKIYKEGLKVDADIYQIHDPELLPFCKKLKKKGKKVIFDSHELYAEQILKKRYLPRWVLRIINHFYKKVEKKALRVIDAVIFPCLINGGHPFQNMCKRAITVDNFPLLNEFYDKYDETTEKIPNSICYIGNISYSRGIKELLESTRISGSFLHLAGKLGSESIYSEMKIDKLSYVKYYGEVGRNEIFDIVSKSMIGMSNLLSNGQYNKTDNLPTKAYEYLSLGVPVVLTKAPYNEKIVNEYNIGICVDTKDVEATANSINCLMDNKGLIEEMGKKGRKLVFEKMNWSIEEKKLLKLYEEIL